MIDRKDGRGTDITSLYEIPKEVLDNLEKTHGTHKEEAMEYIKEMMKKEKGDYEQGQ